MKYANRFAIVAALAMSAAAAQAASFDFTGDHYPPEVASQSTLTLSQQQQSSNLSREQVRQETIAAGKAGLLDNYGE